MVCGVVPHGIAAGRILRVFDQRSCRIALKSQSGPGGISRDNLMLCSRTYSSVNVIDARGADYGGWEVSLKVVLWRRGGA